MSFLPEYLLDCEEYLYRSFILENKQKTKTNSNIIV